MTAKLEKRVERLEERVEKLSNRILTLEVAFEKLIAELEERKRYFQTNKGATK